MKDRVWQWFATIGCGVGVAGLVLWVGLTRDVERLRAECQRHAGDASSAWRLAREHSDLLDQHDDEIERLAKHAGLERTERRVSPLNDDGGKQ